MAGTGIEDFEQSVGYQPDQAISVGGVDHPGYEGVDEEVIHDNNEFHIPHIPYSPDHNDPTQNIFEIADQEQQYGQPLVVTQVAVVPPVGTHVAAEATQVLAVAEKVKKRRKTRKVIPQATSRETSPEEDENIPKHVNKPAKKVAVRKKHNPAQNAIRYVPTTRIPSIRPGVLTDRDDIALRLKNPKTMTDDEKTAFDVAAPARKEGNRPLCRKDNGEFQGRRCGRPTGQHPRVTDPRVEQDMIHPWEEKYVKKLVETRMVKRKRLIHFIIAYLYANTIGKGKESVEFKQLDRALCVVPLFSDWRNDVNTIKQYRRKSGPNIQMFVRRIRYRNQKTDRRSTSHTDYRHPILFDAPAPGMWALNPRFINVVQRLRLSEKFQQNVDELLKDIKNNCEPKTLMLNDDE